MAIGCECGAWSGERCSRDSQDVRIEFVPDFQRESHRAAGRATTWAGTGQSIRCSRACADQILAADGDWARELCGSSQESFETRHAGFNRRI